MVLPPEASAAAAVASLFFITTAFSPLNFRLTGKGFHLYIPIGISTAFRGVAHAARASFFVGHNLDLMAVYGALNAAGFGIAVAMCCCFLVIWLRRAAHGQPPVLEKLLSLAGRLMVACVIVFGPVLGVVAAIVMYSTHGDSSMLQHGQHVRVASSAGFTAVSALAFLISTYLAVSWLFCASSWLVRNADMLPPPAAAAAEAAFDYADPDSQQEQQQQRRQPQRADGLVFVLAGCLLLLCWAASARLAQYHHPEVASSTVLHYCVSVLPELIVAAVFSAPTLAARVALGGHYSAWLRQQQEAAAAGGSSNGSGASSTADAEIGVDANGGQQGGK